jgi:GTP-binding protein HflX
VVPEFIVSPEMARSMTELSMETGRQIGVLLSRAGRVEYVIVGDSRGIVIPSLSQVRVGGGRLKGLRCVHTHLAGEGLSEDDLLDLACLRLDLMAVLKIQPDGLPERLYAAHLLPDSQAEQSVAFLEPVVPTQQPPIFLELVEALEAELTRLRPVLDVDRNRDRAILVSVSNQPKSRAQESMDELIELVRSDAVEVVDTVVQRRDRIQPRTILGKGKLAEIMLKALRLQANLLVFDQELNPSQVRSITDHSDLRVIDRTQLILDIFARRALSREGKLQVEMAQLKYLLPRLVTRDDALSRLTGGIGGRGPGETKLEVDRRRIDDRLNNLAKQLKGVARERHQRRSRRRKRDLPVVSLVGYTNTGKSTLLNMLTRSAVKAEDKLFATLDPTSRRLRFPEDIEVIVTDTVGFIRNLPDELMQAFKSTLEELYEADVLVHVIDLANPRFPEQVAVVENMLRDLDLDRIPQLRLLNKADLVDPEVALHLAAQLDGVLISALNPTTFGPFLERARSMVLKRWGHYAG